MALSTTQEKTKFAFTPAEKKRLKEIKSRYPDPKAASLPALWLAQRRHGWISHDVCTVIAEELGVSPSHILGVATFYTMFNKKPVGKYLIQVCATLSCSLMGAEHVYDYISKKLGINNGETTADGKFTLMKVECLASCGTAPMMQINDDYHESLTEEKVDQILDSLE
jgi:NADH-quinone oxidoreductase subunit E